MNKIELKLSKNAPCPCSSGKKYKKCCMGEISEEHDTYYALLHKESIVKDMLVRWASQNFDYDELNTYANEFNKKNFNELESDEEITPFFDWFFLEAIHKGKEKRMLKVIIDDFSHLFDPVELKIMKEWAKNTQSGVFEVEKIDKDNWRTSLKEIFTQKKYEIIDRKAATSAIKGDIIFGRIQKIFSNYYLSGAITSYPRFTLLGQLKDFVNDRYNLIKQKNPSITYEQFMNSNSKILNDFVPKMPKFVAPDGEEAKMCEAIYSIDLNHIEEILDWFDDNENFLITDEDYKGDKFKSAIIACIKQKNRGKIYDTEESPAIITQSHYVDEDRNKIETEGSIEIKNSEFKVFSQSENVFKKIVNKIEKNIGNHLESEKEEIKSVDEVIDEFKEDKKESPKKKKKDANLIKLEKQIMDQYYKDWCDQRIPALNNKTPRESIKTGEGKELLKSLLLDLENEEEHKKREGEKYIHTVKIIRDELNFHE
ncbi:MAG: SEC-C domain-containing protein [Nanoarchaeota archaeon]|nr:SEC-C domain-containing protein [Nanoarchaeota archaeon]